jgi:hypothetical protein
MSWDSDFGTFKMNIVQVKEFIILQYYIMKFETKIKILVMRISAGEREGGGSGREGGYGLNGKVRRCR